MKYRATFSGRRIGAIGVWLPFEVIVEAPNETDAMLKLYETHEHISALDLRPVDAPRVEREPYWWER